MKTPRNLLLPLLPLALALFLFPVLAVAQENEVASGTWTKKNYSVEGGWSLVETAEGRFVVLDSEFKTQKAPDLKIFVSPLSLDEVSNRTATKGAKRIAILESPKGSQRYKIPVTVDLSNFSTIIIHCEEYSKVWAAAMLHLGG